MNGLIYKLQQRSILDKDEFIQLIENRNEELDKYLFEKASSVSRNNFGNKIYIRGLIEVSNYCKNDCYYCGIRKSNKNCIRYRLTKEEILECCKTGYSLGFKTFVLQGGEDNSFNDDKLCDVVRSIRQKYPECAITLSMGEKSYDSYKKLFDAGANRYLLRHETATDAHYAKLHPENLSLAHRKQCLYNLKEIGYQTGTGFMVGSPYQTAENLAEDLLFIHELQPQMVGIGPFIPHADTPFANRIAGTLELTLFMLGILRLMLPDALLPSTTALATIDSKGREKGIVAGANVVMPNLSPIDVRAKYMLYNNKVSTGEEAAESLNLLKKKINNIGYEISYDIGNYKGF